MFWARCAGHGSLARTSETRTAAEMVAHAYDQIDQP